MASVALDPAYRRVEVDEFLSMDFGGARAELDDGIIFMMAGGSVAHARLAARFLRHLGNALEGSGCEALGSDLAIRTGPRTIRYPDVSVLCDPRVDADRVPVEDPRVVVEVLSPSTSVFDQTVKLAEYQALPSVREIVFVDPDAESVQVFQRLEDGSWSGASYAAPAPMLLPSIGVSLPLERLFTTD